MKKLLFLITLMIPLLGCKKDNNEFVQCDAAYSMNIVVKNETNKVVLMTNKYPESSIGWEDQTIPAGETNDHVSFMIGLGPCENDRLSVDMMHEDEIVFGTNIGTSVFRISVGGEDVTDDIWLRKYWTYTPGYFDETYTLTITDELLASLPHLSNEE